MKKMKWMMLVAFTVTVTTGYSQIANKNEMVKTIFTILKNKDEKGFIKLFPDAATMRAYIMKMMSADSTKANMAEMMEGFLNEITDSSLQVEFRKDFKKIIKKGEDKGVDWAHSNFSSFTADSSLADEDGMKMSKLKGKIYFNSRDKDYFLSFNEVVWFENAGWYGVSVKRVDEKSNEALADKDAEDDLDIDMMTADSAMAMVDSVALPPPPPKPKKPVQKQTPPKTTPKTKTQTPARKP